MSRTETHIDREEPTEPQTPIVPEGMVLIPAGDFQMGSNDYDNEQPVHTVYVDAFYMDTHEVTNAEYKTFVLANPQWQKTRIPDVFHNRYYLFYWDWDGNNYPVGEADHPVTWVSWYAAMAYSAWVGKRLPTEAEWEKAARGGNVGDTRPVGSYAANGYGLDMAGNVWEWCLDAYDWVSWYAAMAYSAWVGKRLPTEAEWEKAARGGNVGDTRPVGSYAANGYGLDMAGNVWEWCLDAYDADFYSASPSSNPLSGVSGSMLANLDEIVSDYTNIKSSRALRGGSWNTDTRPLRAADRTGCTPMFTSNGLGFRCARAVTP